MIRLPVKSYESNTNSDISEYHARIKNNVNLNLLNIGNANNKLLRMKKILRTGLTAVIALTALFASAPQAQAQYYEIASQIPDLLSPALSGSLRYKGFVEGSGLGGIGTNRANFLGVSTTQGFQYSSWFFMGVGVGVDVAMSQVESEYGNYDSDDAPSYYYHETAKTKVMIPVFTDLRFNIGNASAIAAYIDLKFGATWLMGNSFLRLQNGCLGTSTQFYFKPSVGVRIPVSKSHPQQAINIGVTYQLITSNNNYAWVNNNSVTLNNLGASIAFEW